MTGITTINLGGQQRTLSFKNNFLWKLGTYLGVDPIDVAEKIQQIATDKSAMQAMTIIVYCGMVAFYERQGNYNPHVDVFKTADDKAVKISEPFTIAHVAEWVDDADQNEFATVWRSFADIMGIPEASEKQIQEYETRLKKKGISMNNQNKKNPTGKTSSNTP